MGIPDLHNHQSSSNTLLPLAFLSLILIATPAAVLAHSGHGEHFQAGSEATGAADSIQVDAEIAKRIGIKATPATRQRLAAGIKTTGQIETLPNQKVEVTSPISQATVVDLLVKPGAFVKAGQPVAVLAAPDLVELRVESQEKLAEAQADIQQAQADLKLAQQNLELQRQIAAADIAQARTEVDVAQEQYNRDLDLVRAGAIPRREMLESKAHLDEGKAKLTKAASRQEVLEAQAQLKRAQSAVEVAKTRIRLSNATYQTRLQQLNAKANEKGLVTVTAPISGIVTDREATLGQSFEDAGGKLMTIVNDSRVFATANIYEKDLDKIEQDQQVNLKIASQPGRTFTGRIAVIGSAVEGETRVIPVKAEVDNSSKVLKPGMFAQLEVLTSRTPKAILAIPSSAVVEANGKRIVYVQSGDAYQSVEVTLGQNFGDMIEVKTGLFDGDLVVTQRATQLYAQSLRGGFREQREQGEQGGRGAEGQRGRGAEGQRGRGEILISYPKSKIQNSPATSFSHQTQRHSHSLRWWLVGAAGGAGIAVAAFMAGMFWSNRRTSGTGAIASVASPTNGHSHHVSVKDFHAGTPSADQSSESVDNHHVNS